MEDELKDTLTQAGKAVGDGTSITILAATLVEILPAAAALITIVWTSIRIYETKTVQKWLKGKRP